MRWQMVLMESSLLAKDIRVGVASDIPNAEIRIHLYRGFLHSWAATWGRLCEVRTGCHRSTMDGRVDTRVPTLPKPHLADALYAPQWLMVPSEPTHKSLELIVQVLPRLEAGE